MRKYLICLICSLAIPGLAQDQPLVSRMEVFVIEADEDGRERVSPADEAVPGSVLEYRLTYENVSAGPLRGIAVTGPVPDNTAYVAASAVTEVAARLVVSIDGGGTWESEPVERERTLADGTVETFVVDASEYTHVRWLSDETLAPQGLQEFSYRVVVE